MKIKRINLWHQPLISHTDYHMAAGKSCTTVETVIVRIDSDTGLSGWGEVCPIPHYLPAYARGVAPAIAEMAPELIGAEFSAPEALLARLDSWLIGHAYAKSALDIALWDLLGRALAQPLHRLLGGKRNQRLPIYHSVTCIAPKAMLAIAEQAYSEGIRQIQVKLGADGDWRNDVERLLTIREALPADALVYGDWNSGATMLDATRVARTVQGLDIMLEQPCETIEQCAQVRRASGLAMKLDESAHDFASLMQGAQLGCMDAVAVKTSKFGGLSRARRARDLCCELGVKMCIEDTWGSDIATAAALHLAAATDAKFILNVCDLSHYVAPRLDPNAPSREHGYITPSDTPGLGVEPKLDKPELIFD